MMGRRKSLPAGMRYMQDGKRIQYRFTVDGKRYAVYGLDKNECYQKAEAKEKELSEGQYKKSKDLTISEYFDRWIKAKEREVKETTTRTRIILFKIASNTSIDKNGNTFGNLKIADIEKQNILDIRENMIQAGKSTRTVNDIISLIKYILQCAVDDKTITWNPAAGIKRIHRTEPAAKDTYHRALTEAETKAFFKAAKEHESWYYNLYCFLIKTGCRCGEAGAIQNSDISGKAVHVHKTITRTAEGTYRIGDEAKTKAGNRYIPIEPEARQAIERQREINRLLNNGITGINDTLFKSPRGCLLSDTVVNQDIARICKAAGVQKFTAHAFRDTFATRCVEFGMQPKTLQEIMGHSKISVTMNYYVHVMEETKVSQMQAVKIAIV